MILLMKQEILESYITYIFDFFQKSRCFKAGQGNMLRNFRFAAEKQFTRNQLGILYFLVNTLIDNGYLYLKIEIYSSYGEWCRCYKWGRVCYS